MEFLTKSFRIAIRSVNASSGRDTTSVMANSERDEDQLFTGLFENVFVRNSTPHVFGTNDEIRNRSLDAISELSVAREFFDWKPHTSGPVRGQLIQEMCHDTQLLDFFIVHNHTTPSRNIFPWLQFPGCFIHTKQYLISTCFSRC